MHNAVMLGYFPTSIKTVENGGENHKKMRANNGNFNDEAATQLWFGGSKPSYAGSKP